MPERRLATVELLGALTYGQVRSFQVTADAIRLAPDAKRADRLADFAGDEHRRYVALRTCLREETDLSIGMMDRLRSAFDDYFDHVALTDWVTACAFFAVGLPLVADFIAEVAPLLDEPVGSVVQDALGERTVFAEFASSELKIALEKDPDLRPRLHSTIADVLGRALTGFQAAVADTDALAILLKTADGSDAASDDLIRRVAIRVLEGHRRRMVDLGLEDFD